MSLEEIFYMSQTVASVAVVASLVFVGLQVRGAERAQRALMQQGRADRTASASIKMADPALAPIWHKGLSGADLTPDEFVQWMMLARSSFLSGEDSFLQYKAGQLDRRAFDSYVAGATFYMTSPGLRAAWKISAGQFGREFREFVTSLVEAAPLARDGDVYAEWHRLLKAELSHGSVEKSPKSDPPIATT
jgi:hypothetical protein